MTESSRPMNRRSFLGTSAALIAGSALVPRTAASYEKILGANDRISLGHIGTGHRGDDLDLIVSKLKTSHHAEMTAVCDLWKTNREKAAATNEKYYGRAPRAVQYPEELLAMKDLDGVLISTPEHSHSPILKMATDAGKDAYVEKPMGNVLAEAKAARDAVLHAKTVVQVGTQHRSEPYPNAAHEIVKERRAGRDQQSRNRLELSRPALARSRRSPADPRAGHGLDKVADDEAGPPVRSAALFRVPPVQGVFQWHLGPVDESRHRPGALVHGRHCAALGDRTRRSVRLARRPPESRHIPGPARISQGISGQLLDQLRQRRAQLHALHGKEGDVDESGWRRQSALSSSRRKGHARRRLRHRQEARIEVRSAP